jgi:hypothetical protein
MLRKQERGGSLSGTAAQLGYRGSGCYETRELTLGLEGSEPSGSDSHRRLLTLAGLEVEGVRPAWFDAATLDALRELLGFRHLFRHGYGARYRPARLRELAQLAVATWPTIRTSLSQARSLVVRLAMG